MRRARLAGGSAMLRGWDDEGKEVSELWAQITGSSNNCVKTDLVETNYAVDRKGSVGGMRIELLATYVWLHQKSRLLLR